MKEDQQMLLRNFLFFHCYYDYLMEFVLAILNFLMIYLLYCKNYIIFRFKKKKRSINI